MTAYEEIKALNWGTLKLAATSPALLRWRADHPAEDKPAYQLGRVVHCKILEPDEYGKRYAVYPGRRAGKAYDEWCEQHPGVEVIAQHDDEIAGYCAARIEQHRVASQWLKDTRREITVRWQTEIGTACKGRLDAIGQDYIVDLKTTSKQDLRGILRDAAIYLYHGQLAWYHDGAISAGLLPHDARPPRMVCVQTVEPYDVVAVELAPHTLEAGRELYSTLLRLYRECTITDMWPGMAPDVVTWGIEQWAADRVLEIGGEL